MEQGLYDIFKSDNAYYVYSASEWLEEMNKIQHGHRGIASIRCWWAASAS